MPSAETPHVLERAPSRGPRPRLGRDESHELLGNGEGQRHADPAAWVGLGDGAEDLRVEARPNGPDGWWLRSPMGQGGRHGGTLGDYPGFIFMSPEVLCDVPNGPDHVRCQPDKDRNTDAGKDARVVMEAQLVLDFFRTLNGQR
jgi:hypothetical protein